MNNVPIPEPMNVTSGNVAEKWSYFREQWNDYEIATGLREKDKKIRVTTLRGIMGKDSITFIKTGTKKKHSYGVVFHTHGFAAFCELTAVTIEGKQLDHISWNVREVPFQRAQRVSLSRRYGESNQVVLHESRGCYH